MEVIIGMVSNKGKETMFGIESKLSRIDSVDRILGFGENWTHDDCMIVRFRTGAKLNTT